MEESRKSIFRVQKIFLLVLILLVSSVFVACASDEPSTTAPAVEPTQEVVTEESAPKIPSDTPEIAETPTETADPAEVDEDDTEEPVEETEPPPAPTDLETEESSGFDFPEITFGFLTSKLCMIQFESRPGMALKYPYTYGQMAALFISGFDGGEDISVRFISPPGSEVGSIKVSPWNVHTVDDQETYMYLIPLNLGLDLEHGEWTVNAIGASKGASFTFIMPRESDTWMISHATSQADSLTSPEDTARSENYMPGDAIQFNGINFEPATELPVGIYQTDGIPVQGFVATTDEDGVFSSEITLNSDIPDGEYYIFPILDSTVDLSGSVILDPHKKLPHIFVGSDSITNLEQKYADCMPRFPSPTLILPTPIKPRLTLQPIITSLPYDRSTKTATFTSTPAP